MSEIVITTLAERPEYRERLYDFADAWPEFMWFADLRQGRRPTVSSALEILIRPSHLGRGLSHRMLAAMRAAVKANGHTTLFAPVRPNGKADAMLPMTEYVVQDRDDGLPTDPWLRVHVKAGAKIVKVAPRSMVIAGHWRNGGNGPGCRSTRRAT